MFANMCPMNVLAGKTPTLKLESTTCLDFRGDKDNNSNAASCGVYKRDSSGLTTLDVFHRSGD